MSRGPLKDVTINSQDISDLRFAKQLLEHPGIAAKIADKIGKPIEIAMDLLPEKVKGVVHRATEASISKALQVAVKTMSQDVGAVEARNALHKLLVGVTGAAGGAFGVAALPVELPISTTLMLRSIMDIARSEGERIEDAAARLACLEVFALGGGSSADDAAESGYFATRIALSRAIGEAATFIAQKGLVEEGAPLVARLIMSIAARFEVVVTQKVAAELVPVVGAAGGAAINLLFMNHFQAMARGHFIIRRLEKKYGPSLVREHYEILVTSS